MPTLNSCSTFSCKMKGNLISKMSLVIIFDWKTLFYFILFLTLKNYVNFQFANLVCVNLGFRAVKLCWFLLVSSWRDAARKVWIIFFFLTNK